MANISCDGGITIWLHLVKLWVLLNSDSLLVIEIDLLFSMMIIHSGVYSMDLVVFPLIRVG